MIRFLYLILLIVIIGTKAIAFELIMIDSKNCVYCTKFKNEVIPDFNISNLPIIIVEQSNQPKWFIQAVEQKKIKPWRGTPIFIVWNDLEKYEIDRISGYLGKDNFHNQLEKIFVNFLKKNSLSN